MDATFSDLARSRAALEARRAGAEAKHADANDWSGRNLSETA
jgi:hypothetical protein